ncbi:uncharacterized protein LOC126552502 [Aphis gossypii]|uniref:uncharacterized protein LOC126552502 n=1 Tax=Aphis gossypii TaxID=80765 RepID=UPI002158DB9F|nr:uncharacterized protein LOC126552502 [Aphis gossypii]
MIDTWLMLNDTDKWIEGLDIIQFQMNHNIYHEVVHLPTNFNNSYSSNSKQCVTELKSTTKSVFGTNIQVKRINMNNGLSNRIQTVVRNFQKKTKFNLKTETELSMFSNLAEDNDKYEIINEILNKIKHQNPISGFREIHNNEYPQLHQKAAKKCSSTKIPQKHNECSISNTYTFNVDDMLVSNAVQGCSNVDGMQSNEESIGNNTTDKEKLPELVQEATSEYSNLEDVQGNKESNKSNITIQKELNRLVQEAVQECSNLVELPLQGDDECI